jgi:ABC-type nitrate/sulfonate/bicarbonate transport system ATPase subunit
VTAQNVAVAAADAKTAALAFERVTCAFAGKTPGERYTAVADTSLVVEAGQFVSVVGPTGCGKSTLLNVAAGTARAVVRAGARRLASRSRASTRVPATCSRPRR